MKDILLVAGLFAGSASVSVHQYLAQTTVDRNDPRLGQLRQYFAKHDCPLRDSAEDFLIAADQNKLDWRLLPSISMIESSGGKDYRNNNVLGWDSCRERFSSVREGIHYVAAQLARAKAYRDKDLDGKLKTYNPLPEYPGRIKAVMRALAVSSQPQRTIAVN